MYSYILLQIVGVTLCIIGILFLITKAGFWGWIYKRAKKLKVNVVIGLGILLAGMILVMAGDQSYKLHFAMPPNLHSQAPDQNPPSLPIFSALDFLRQSGGFEKVKDISRDPNEVPAPITRKTSRTVKMSLTAKEVISEVAPGIYNNYWTYNGKVPGPMLRVREGDNVEISLKNDKSSLHTHNIDLHAVTGPGGGATLTKVKPGASKTFSWKALQPGLYIYHCATSNVSVHNSHGQYGLILVEPKEGLPKVDKEFYVVQGELYTQGGIGKKGLVLFDPNSLLDGNPTYITFNGKINAAAKMKVKKGQTVRIYVGNGGVNLVSSFHIIGEIFDTVYPEAAMGKGSAIYKNVQTTAVLPGGAAIVEFKADVPGKYILVDHALARMNKGAWALLEVEGSPSPDIFRAVNPSADDMMDDSGKMEMHDQ
jgi:nitrite reductase (NO-forming)